ncbi:hypothetical protein ACRAWD_02595 [Caulobacter segnis]
MIDPATRDSRFLRERRRDLQLRHVEHAAACPANNEYYSQPA